MKKLAFCLSSTIAVVMLLGFSVGVAQAGKCELPDFDDYEFDIPMDNPYLPIPDLPNLGDVKTYVYEAEDEDGLLLNNIQFSTDTVNILGVTCTVVYDVEWIWVEDLDVWFKLEETKDWHAWDNYGNFWYFGEETVEYLYDDDWEPDGTSTEGSWKAGVNGALPGIILPADPGPGDCVVQEYYEDVAEDMGKVLKVKATCEDLYGNESDECMVMKEWTALEPGNVEHKLYYPGLGLVHIKELKEKTVEVELVDIY